MAARREPKRTRGPTPRGANLDGVRLPPSARDGAPPAEGREAGAAPREPTVQQVRESDETLLAAFAEGPLFDWYQAGRSAVTIDDTTAWIAELTSSGAMPPTTAIVRTKVARGLLAALRDFGILQGATHKRFTHPHISLRGFAYVAFRLHEQGASSTALVTSSVWRRWILDRDRIDDLLFQAARSGLLDYGVVGSAVRVDWHVTTIEEAVRAAA